MAEPDPKPSLSRRIRIFIAGCSATVILSPLTWCVRGAIQKGALRVAVDGGKAEVVDATADPKDGVNSGRGPASRMAFTR